MSNKRISADLDMQAIRLANRSGARRDLAEMDRYLKRQERKKRRTRFEQAKRTFLRRVTKLELCALGVALGCVAAIHGLVIPGCAVITLCAAGGTIMLQKCSGRKQYGCS